MKLKLTLVTAAIAAATLAALLGGVLREGTAAAEPASASSLVRVGGEFQQRWRETAEATYLARAEAALARAVRLEPGNVDAVEALGAVALSQHDFRRALALGRRAHTLAPGRAGALGVIGDALLELGRYDEAFGTIDRLAALRPGLAAYARVAYARELLGRPRDALDAMRLALQASGGRGEPAAWAHVEVAKLHFGLGELAPAGAHFRAALAAFPGYPYALDGLARVEGARGRLSRAIGFARRAVDAVPQPQFVATLTDLYETAGRSADARRQYRLVRVIERLLQAGGVRADLETALFDVDHGLRLENAVARARRAQAERPGIEADAVLAWALARTGRCGEALRYSRRALRLGTLDAPKFFHRGQIERCLGRDEAARGWFRKALALNPHFSLRWAPVARRYSR